MASITSLILLLAIVSAVTGVPVEEKSNVPKSSVPRRHSKRLPTSFVPGHPLSINRLEDLVYIIDVTVGEQRCNLTLDTRARDAVLFSTKYKSSNHTCTAGEGKRRFFDTGLSGSYKDTGKAADGWTHYALYRYPYVGAECAQQVGWAEELEGTLGSDVFDLQIFSAEGVPLILANYTFYALNPRWASDGVFPPWGQWMATLWKQYFRKSAQREKLHSSYPDLSPGNKLPTVYFRLFVKVFGAEYDSELDTYTVDCRSNGCEAKPEMCSPNC